MVIRDRCGVNLLWDEADICFIQLGIDNTGGEEILNRTHHIGFNGCLEEFEKFHSKLIRTGPGDLLDTRSMRFTTKSLEVERVLIPIFGPLFDSLFLFEALFLGSFVIVRYVLLLLIEALSCNLAHFYGFLMGLYILSFFFLNESQIFSLKEN